MAYGDQHSKQRAGLGWKTVAGFSLATLLGGVLLAGWLITQFDLWPGNGSAQEAAADKNTSAAGAGKAGTNASAAADQADGKQGEEAAAVAAKVEELADRLSQIDAGKDAAGAYSARADAIVTALRVRRAIESGAALGYTENQLRLRFDGSHPQAVAAIQAVALDSVKLADLSNDLARNGARMTGGGDEESLWTRISTEFSELFALRRRGTPSTTPSQVLQRAEQNIANGNVRDAIADIENLPENEARQKWLTDAKRYLAARDALDTIERAALSSPVNVPALSSAPALAPEADETGTKPPAAGTAPESE
ncbi:MAG: hypothetical protein V3V15_00260 [Sphingorhabdus sp.]